MGRLYDKFLNLIVDKKLYSETWYYDLTGEWRATFPDELKRWQIFLDSQRKLHSLLPSDPHCHECGIPMAGFGGGALRFMGSEPSSFNPKLCSLCEKSARQYEVGAEVELTMRFANVRDSTPLAESKSTNGPWVPVAAGIHTGRAYVGAVGTADGVTEIAVLGSAANMCARLSSKAGAGEILISEESVKSGNLDVAGLDSRSLELKGLSQPVSVRVMNV